MGYRQRPSVGRPEGLEGEACGGSRGQIGADTALGYSQLKTQVKTQTENPIWNQILTLQIQVLPSHHACPPPLPHKQKGCLGVGVCISVVEGGAKKHVRGEGSA